MYLFILKCCVPFSETGILSTFFSVLLLLMILSKVVIFAKKSAYAHTRSNHFGLDEVAFRRRGGIRRGARERRDFTLVPENREVSNPLLMPYRCVFLQFYFVGVLYFNTILNSSDLIFVYLIN